MMEATPTSPVFVTITSDRINGGSQVPPLSPTQLTHGTPVKCMFNSVDDVSALSVIFGRSMTSTSQELSGGAFRGLIP